MVGFAAIAALLPFLFSPGQGLPMSVLVRWLCPAKAWKGACNLARALQAEGAHGALVFDGPAMRVHLSGFRP